MRATPPDLLSDAPAVSESTALVCVAGPRYRRYAEALMESAREHFHPTETVELLILDGEDGWPIGTMCRHAVLLANRPRTHFTFLVDADMIFESACGPEILPRRNGHPFGITATLHPGYVGRSQVELPYERDPDSAAYIAHGDGGTYFCGGFIGGERLAMSMLSTQIDEILVTDGRRGRVPAWHDESALNRVLVTNPPDLVLSPAFCHPANDHYYRREVWREEYGRILVAVDKSHEERGER